jgi:hypothetical protein
MLDLDILDDKSQDDVQIFVQDFGLKVLSFKPILKKMIDVIGLLNIPSDPNIIATLSQHSLSMVQ